MYELTTRNIRIIVRPQFLENQSKPDEHHFMWAYTILLENLGLETVKLLTRYWLITDGLGRVHEVRGDGVIGEQPILRSGERFEYNSGCPLSTSSGTMEGRYGMINEQGEKFDVIIPAFSLDSPYLKRSLN
jgi:ApaG protein